MGGIRPVCFLALFLGLVAGWATAADAAFPLDQLLTFNRIEADPDKVYKVTEENGPWMVMATSFSGDGAEEQAQELVYELRKRYKLPAFMHKMRFDFGEARGRGFNAYGGPIRARYRRGSGQEEIAVLVGNYRAVDDPDAQKTLQKLKYTLPRCLDVKEGTQTNQNLAAWRRIQKQILAPGNRKKEKGPMGHAFVTTNPTLPKEYFDTPTVDQFVIKLNKDFKYSLLDCPGKYTVQVATFKGNVIIEPEEIRAIESGKKLKSKLAEAADKAHRLTEALRMKGYEAYEFHDRYSSIVTVGSFNSAGTPRADGMTEINPGIHTIMQTFGTQQLQLPGQTGGGTTKVIVGIPLDIQPRPVHVPKRSISREITARSLF